MVHSISYRGRFAPSPTGPLHFGSLVAATASWLDARAAGGEWLVRMEDLDTPRNQPGAAGEILFTLERFGLTWDGTCVHQSQRLELYRAALEDLKGNRRAYPCGCTRREIADSQLQAADSGERPYPGTCRNGMSPDRTARAWRFRIEEPEIEFIDRLQGPQRQDVESTCGDFVLLRADGIYAYQLAVVVDDAAQGVTDIVRGADLLASTPRQIALQSALGLPRPRYLHLPAAVNRDGEKLSKQTRARALGQRSCSDELWDALTFLGHPPAGELRGATPAEILQGAARQWSPAHLPAGLFRPAPERFV